MCACVFRIRRAVGVRVWMCVRCMYVCMHMYVYVYVCVRACACVFVGMY